jgi:hypothetical protein
MKENKEIDADFEKYFRETFYTNIFDKELPVCKAFKKTKD